MSISAEVRRLDSGDFNEREAATERLKALCGRFEAEGKKDDLAGALKALAQAAPQAGFEAQSRIQAILDPYRAWSLRGWFSPTDPVNLDCTLRKGLIPGDPGGTPRDLTLSAFPHGVLASGTGVQDVGWIRLYDRFLDRLLWEVGDLPAGNTTCWLSADGRVACLACDSRAGCRIRVYDAEKGRLLWGFPATDAEGPIPGRVVAASVGSDVVVIGTDGPAGRLHAFESATGKTFWTAAGAGWITTLSASPGSILASRDGAGGRISCHDARTGEARWEIKVKELPGLITCVLAAGPDLYAGGKAEGPWLARIDPANGQVLWTTEEKECIGDLARITLADGRLFASGGEKISGSGWLGSWDAGTGNKVWGKRSPDDLPSLPSHAAIPEGILAYGATVNKKGIGFSEPWTHQLWAKAWNPADGRLLWEKRITLPGSPEMMDAGSGGLLVAGTDWAQVYCLPDADREKTVPVDRGPE